VLIIPERNEHRAQTGGIYAAALMKGDLGVRGRQVKAKNYRQARGFLMSRYADMSCVKARNHGVLHHSEKMITDITSGYVWWQLFS